MPALHMSRKRERCGKAVDYHVLVIGSATSQRCADRASSGTMNPIVPL